MIGGTSPSKENKFSQPNNQGNHAEDRHATNENDGNAMEQNKHDGLSTTAEKSDDYKDNNEEYEASFDDVQPAASTKSQSQITDHDVVSKELLEEHRENANDDSQTPLIRMKSNHFNNHHQEKEQEDSSKDDVRLPEEERAWCRVHDSK
jgi:hypothetical protein